MSVRASRDVSDGTSGQAAAIPDEVARPHYVGRWVTGLVLLALAATAVRSLAHNPQLEWRVVGHYIFDARILDGLEKTAALAVISMAFATVIGVLMGFCRLSANPVLRVLGRVYVWVFRSVPTLIQILFWGNLALFTPRLGLGVPGTDLMLFSTPTNQILSVFAASVVALSVANGAYLAEIVRSGVLSVDEGQRLAAAALGLNWWQTQRKVVRPQAMRVMIPPAGNQFITLLKETSLASVIAGGDILSQAQNISGENLRTVELLIVAAIWYLAVTSAASAGQSLLERRTGRGNVSRVQRRRGRRGSPTGSVAVGFEAGRDGTA